MLLFLLGYGVTAFLGLSYLLGVLHFPGELLQLSQQTLVLACMVSRVPSGGRLSMSPCWSCILGGLA